MGGTKRSIVGRNRFGWGNMVRRLSMCGLVGAISLWGASLGDVWWAPAPRFRVALWGGSLLVQWIPRATPTMPPPHAPEDLKQSWAQPLKPSETRHSTRDAWPKGPMVVTFGVGFEIKGWKGIGGLWRPRVSLSTLRSTVLIPFWIPTCLFGGLLAYFCSPLHKRRQRRRASLCESCGYDLTGNVSGVCPECGRPVVIGTDST